MIKRITVGCLALMLGLFYSFSGEYRRHAGFSRMERRMLHIPTAGLFGNGGYFTVTPSVLARDGWRFPVSDGVCFTPDFPKHPVGWYIMSDRKGKEVKAAMRGLVRLVRKTDLGKTIVILHPSGLETVYAHHAKALVKSGDYVAAGQPIARAAADHGMVYTYFSLMVNGVMLSPSTFAEPDGKLKANPVKFSLSPEGEVNASFYQDGAVEEHTPGFEWLDGPERVDLSRPFSARERQDVGVPTPGLFADESWFAIELGRISRWCYPLPGAKVISPYGGARKNHTGTDIKTRPNDKIRAVFDGVVRFSGPYSAYGNIVVIRHANGLETCYSHNARNLVRVGDRVKAGDPIALMGRTGRATTEHCHFEVRANGVPFNSDYIFDHSHHVLKSGKLIIRRKSGGGITVKAE